jgi:hypothetical protein
MGSTHARHLEDVRESGGICPQRRLNGRFVRPPGSGHAAIERPKSLLHLPEMPALMGRQDSQCTVNTVAHTRAHGRLYLHRVDRQSHCRPGDFRQLILRLQKGFPCRWKIIPLRREMGKHFMPQAIGRFQRADQNLRQHVAAQWTVSGKSRSLSHDLCNRRQKHPRRQGKVLQAFRNRPGILPHPRSQIFLRPSKHQPFRVSGRVLHLLQQACELKAQPRITVVPRYSDNGRSRPGARSRLIACEADGEKLLDRRRAAREFGQSGCHGQVPRRA